MEECMTAACGGQEEESHWYQEHKEVGNLSR